MSPLAALFGAVVGLSLGLTGGGGAIFAVPLLVYGLGVDPREAIGASLATVGATALVGFLQRWRVGLVEMRTGLLFAVAGMTTAPLGSRLAARIPETLLLFLFALLMLVVAVRMWRKARDVAERHVLVIRPDEPGPVCRRDPQGVLHWNSRCALLLVGVGLGTGLLTGLFGAGGGFIDMPPVGNRFIGRSMSVGAGYLLAEAVTMTPPTTFSISPMFSSTILPMTCPLGVRGGGMPSVDGRTIAMGCFSPTLRVNNLVSSTLRGRSAG